MSAMTGICDFFAMTGSASASSWVGQATRTIWQPVAVSSAICWSVAPMSAVLVVVMDWTLTGAPPPTRTPPTLSCLVRRRSASGSISGRFEGIPRFTAVIRLCRPDTPPFEMKWEADPPLRFLQIDMLAC